LIVLKKKKILAKKLKRLYDKIQKENTIGSAQKIVFNTDWKIFFWGDSVEILKESSPDFTDQERIKAFQLLDLSPGNTNDYSALEELLVDIEEKWEEYKDKIKKWEIKKIALIITDGGSDDAERLSKIIKKLKILWVLLYGIGLWDDYEDVIVNYNTWDNNESWYGIPCEAAENLPSTLLNILSPHLERL